MLNIRKIFETKKAEKKETKTQDNTQELVLEMLRKNAEMIEKIKTVQNA